MVPLRVFLFGLALLVLVGGGFLIFRRQEPVGTPLAKPLNQVTETEPILGSTGTTVAMPLVENPSPTPKTGNNLVVRAKEPVWVRVRLDDAVRFEGTLTAGEVRTWPFTGTMRLRVGNISRIAVTLNGKSVAESNPTRPRRRGLAAPFGNRARVPNPGHGDPPPLSSDIGGPGAFLHRTRSGDPLNGSGPRGLRGLGCAKKPGGGGKPLFPIVPRRMEHDGGHSQRRPGGGSFLRVSGIGAAGSSGNLGERAS